MARVHTVLILLCTEDTGAVTGAMAVTAVTVDTGKIIQISISL